MITNRLLLVALLCIKATYALIPEITFKPISGYPAFSYLNRDISQFVNERYSSASLLPKAAPSIGIYGTPYNFPTIYGGVIELQPAMLAGKLPQPLQTALQRITGSTYEQFIQEPTNHTYAFIIIAPLLKQNNAVASVYNVVYHFFYELISAQKQFHAKMQMGLFVPTELAQSVLVNSSEHMPINQFGPITMDTHPGGEYAVSPSNAQFKANINQPISTYWLAAISPDKKQLSVTYLIFIRDYENIAYIENESRRIRTMADYLRVLQQVAEFYNDVERTQFLSIVGNIKNILKREPRTETDVLLVQLNALKEQLSALHQKLRTLQK